MTATERLRALLDERGVRHADYGSTGTFWTGGSNVEWGAEESGRHWTLFAHDLTPEQAIDATLGRGTCEVECFDDGMDEGMDGEWFSYAPPTWHLSCGHEAYGSEMPRYCSACGKRVVEP